MRLQRLVRKAVAKFSNGKYSSYAVDDWGNEICANFNFDGHVYFVRLIEDTAKGWSISVGWSEITNCWPAWFQEKCLFVVVGHIVACLEMLKDTLP